MFQKTTISIEVDSTQGSTLRPLSYKGGFVGFGTGGYYPAHFDEFKILKGK